MRFNLNVKRGRTRYTGCVYTYLHIIIVYGFHGRVCGVRARIRGSLFRVHTPIRPSLGMETRARARPTKQQKPGAALTRRANKMKDCLSPRGFIRERETRKGKKERREKKNKNKTSSLGKSGVLCGCPLLSDNRCSHILFAAKPVISVWKITVKHGQREREVNRNRDRERKKFN